MPVYSAQIPVRAGHTISFDGRTFHVKERASNDTFLVSHGGETTERHIDWFADQASKAIRIEIDRGADA